MSKDDDNFILFSDNSASDDSTDVSIIPWKILIVDDEKDIHTLTKMVLANYKFENRPLDISSCYSGHEAIEYLKGKDDIAIILLDVVMETDDAGLICVKKIRNELNNQDIRIILRTGQPGQAPEQKVIVEYDINDYKAKTELTASKLFTAITASLRSFQYIKTISQNKKGLENIIDASRFLFELQSFSLFAKGILKQLTSILSLDKDSICINSSSLSAYKDIQKTEYSILAGTGIFSGHEREGIEAVVPKEVHDKLLEAAHKNESIFTHNTYTGYFKTKNGEHTLLYLQWQRPLTQIDKDLISIFSTNVAAAFENISLNNEISEAQREMVCTLSELIEGQSRDTPRHIKCVTDIACLLAEKLELSEDDIYNIRTSTPMHDIGQISIPREILKKPGNLTIEERDIMKKHTTRGYEILNGSSKNVMHSAQIISYQHHEKWDGSGYPQGLKGKDIHIYGRIVGLADVVEALTNTRCYRAPWPMEKVIELVRDERGKHFDPDVADAFLKSIVEVTEIREKYTT